jgi:NAD(P)-dependent dehydrogenase (short-subunit alcohol dehydrogenase family)
MYVIPIVMPNMSNRSTGSVLVTGASSGIGAATATALAQHGYTVGCVSRRGIAPDGGHTIAFQADVADPEAVGAALTALVAEGGPLRGIVNAAGRHTEGDSVDSSLDEAHGVMETNFFGAWSVSRLAYPHLVASGGGTIVNIGSFYDRLGIPRTVAYAASKAAIGSLTRCLAVEWAPDGIRVLNVAPGYVETELNTEFFADPKRRGAIERRIPVRRVGRAEEVAQLTRSLISGGIGFLTGETIYIDGGQGAAL